MVKSERGGDAHDGVVAGVVRGVDLELAGARAVRRCANAAGRRRPPLREGDAHSDCKDNWRAARRQAGCEPVRAISPGLGLRFFCVPALSLALVSAHMHTGATAAAELRERIKVQQQLIAQHETRDHERQ